jgi:hypothetical protein
MKSSFLNSVVGKWKNGKVDAIQASGVRVSSERQECRGRDRNRFVEEPWSSVLVAESGSVDAALGERVR